MATWRDGPEYAPRTRPDAFVEPVAEPLESPAPVADLSAGAPSEHPVFAPPEQPAPDLTMITPASVPSRDPKLAFEVVTAAVTSPTAWSAAHTAPAGVPLTAPAWTPQQPFAGSPPVTGSIPAPAPTQPRVSTNPPPFPEPGTTAWFAPPDAGERYQGPPQVGLGQVLRVITPAVLITLAIGALLNSLSVVMLGLSFALSTRIPYRRNQVRDLPGRGRDRRPGGCVHSGDGGALLRLGLGDRLRSGTGPLLAAAVRARAGGRDGAGQGREARGSALTTPPSGWPAPTTQQPDRGATTGQPQPGWMPPPLGGGPTGWAPPAAVQVASPGRGHVPAPAPRRSAWRTAAIAVCGLVVLSLVAVLVAQWWTSTSSAVNQQTVEVTGGDISTPVELTGADGSALVTVTGARWTTQGEVEPVAGTSYLIVDVQLEGVTGELTIGGVFTAVIAADGQRYGISYGPTLKPLLPSRTLAAGESTTGQLGYQLAGGPVELEFQTPDGVRLGSVAIPGP